MTKKEIQQLADKTWKKKYRLGGVNPYYSMGFEDAMKVAKKTSSNSMLAVSCRICDAKFTGSTGK